MKIFAVSDLHLPGGMDKAMDIFGDHWQEHWDKIQTDWREKVGPEDIVLIAGDISWAMQLAAAVPDLDEIGALPGRKVLLRGNHDYWWSAPSRIRAVLPQGMFILQNDALALDGVLFCGTRGWQLPEQEDFSAEDQKIYDRELLRLEMSLQAMEKLRQPGQPAVALLHYPPHNAKREPSDFCALLEAYGVDMCIYGHLHQAFPSDALDYTIGTVRYFLTSCDYLRFQLTELPLRP